MQNFFQNKTILILGGRGFLGFHIRAYLNYKLNLKNIIVLNKEDLKKDKLNYKNKIIKSDIIFNASGTNRSKIKGQIIKDHKDFVKVILLTLKKKKKETLFINLSSKQQSNKSEYGKSKKYVIDKLVDFSKSNSLITVKNIILPNLFGEFSKPNYNSVVSTFCYNLIKNKKSNILNKNIELMYVGDAIKCFIEKLNKKEIRVKGKIFSVKKVYNILEKQNFDYKKAVVPKFNNFFEKNLFLTYRFIQFNYGARIGDLFPKNDKRGILFEIFKNKNESHSFFSTTSKGSVRGNHFHMRKFERFITLQGKGLVYLKKVFTKKWIKIELNEKMNKFIDIPTFYEHKLINNSDQKLLSIFFTDEIYNEDNSDTFYSNQ